MEISDKDIICMKELTEYYNNNKTLPKYGYVSKCKYNITAWLNGKRVRLKSGSMSDDEIEWLTNSKINFGIKLLKWNDWCSELEKYLVIHKTDHVSSTAVIDNIYKLGSWAKRQITYFNNLNFEQIISLYHLNWDEIKKIETRKGKNILNSKKYKDNKNYKELCIQFKEEQKKLNILIQEDKKNKNVKKEKAKEEERQKLEEERQKLEEERIKTRSDNLDKILYDLCEFDCLYLEILKIEETTFTCGGRGTIIYAEIYNTSEKSIDIEIVDFSLIQGSKQIQYDFYANSFFNKTTTLIPKSCRTLGRMYYDSTLYNGKINDGDVIDFTVKDCLNEYYYSVKFQYSNSRWSRLYEREKRAFDELYLYGRLSEYKNWVVKEIITAEEYRIAKNNLLNLDINGGANYE